MEEQHDWKKIRSRTRDRRALLWVCQRYDLAPDEVPHDYDLDPIEASLRYRKESNSLDQSIAGRYWEAIWLEGARSPVLDCLRSKIENLGSARPLVTLAGAADANAKLSALEFLPIHILPGMLQGGSSPDAEYGKLGRRTRDRIAWDLATRLGDYQGRVLFVVGAKEKSDLEFLFEVLAEIPIVDLAIVIATNTPENLGLEQKRPGLNWLAFKGTDSDLIAHLEAEETPSFSETPSLGIRVGKRVLRIEPSEFDRVQRRFHILLERNLLPVDEFSLEDLHDFLDLNLENWAAFTVGLPIPRSYRTDRERDLAEETLLALQSQRKRAEGELIKVLELPSPSGAGCTTLLRQAAFTAAHAGYPTLIMRPEQIALEVEDVVSFAGSLTAIVPEERMPLLVVFDIEHESIGTVSSLPQILAAHGRPAVILRAVVDKQQKPQRKGGFARLPALETQVDTEEVNECVDTFRTLSEKYDLPIMPPSLGAWRNYRESASSLRGPQENVFSNTMFWVALRFFLMEGLEFSASQRAADSLGMWLERKVSEISDPDAVRILDLVAALSSLRMVSPLWTVVRPITGRQFSSELVGAIQQLHHIIVWGSPNDELSDHNLRFTHPALAEEYLRRRGVNTPEAIFEELQPMVASLSPGHPGDVWVAESLAANFLQPTYEERRNVDWNWRLTAFKSFPTSLAMQSKALLHHWGRCLYQSTQETSLPPQTKENRFRESILKLEKACELERKPGRDEHPSHLYNSLGTALSRYALFLQDNGRKKEEHLIWEKACKAFEKSRELAPGVNIEVLLAFAQNLYKRVTRQHNPEEATVPQIDAIVKALELVSEGDEAASDYGSLDPVHRDQLSKTRAQCLAWLDESVGFEYVRRLQTERADDLGYYCEAQIHLSSEDRAGKDAALKVFERALDSSAPLQPRSIVLLLWLLRNDPTERFNFSRHLKLYEKLGNSPDFSPRPIDSFRYAVVCYQLERYVEGQELFRRLRERLRRTDVIAPRVEDFLREPSNPEKARILPVHVVRVINEWKANGRVDTLGQVIPLKPRHFSPPPKQNEFVTCAVRFVISGPTAVPKKFAATGRRSLAQPT